MVWAMAEHRTRQPGLAGALRAAGLRLTGARRAVIGVLEEQRAEHLSAEDIHRLAKAAGRRLDLASVYRTMNVLAELGLVHRADLAHSHAHFEIDHGEEAHLICTRCGETIEAADQQDVAAALARLAEAQGFALGRFRVEVEGTCERCRTALAVG